MAGGMCPGPDYYEKGRLVPAIFNRDQGLMEINSCPAKFEPAGANYIIS
jgi:hypothetical protein